MIIHTYGERDKKVPTVMCEGYRCDTVTFEAADAMQMLRMYNSNPDQFKGWINQFTGRFNGNRPPVVSKEEWI